jgi:hypothetical protein
VRTARLALGAAGVAALAWGAWGTVTDPGTHLRGQLAFAATVLIGHDGVVLPAAIAVGAVLSARAPAWLRGPVQGGLFASAVLTFVALPFVVGTGTSPDNPSALPLDYGRGLLVTLGVVWAATAAVAVRGYATRHPRRRGGVPAGVPGPGVPGSGGPMPGGPGPDRGDG